MQVGDLAKDIFDNHIGIILKKDGDYVEIAFAKGSFLMPQEHLEVVSESR